MSSKITWLQRSSDSHLLIYFRPSRTKHTIFPPFSSLPPLIGPGIPHPRSGKTTQTSRSFLIYMPKSRRTKLRLQAQHTATHPCQICTQNPPPPPSSHHSPQTPPQAELKPPQKTTTTSNYVFYPRKAIANSEPGKQKKKGACVCRSPKPRSLDSKRGGWGRCDGSWGNATYTNPQPPARPSEKNKNRHAAANTLDAKKRRRRRSFNFLGEEKQKKKKKKGEGEKQGTKSRVAIDERWREAKEVIKGDPIPGFKRERIKFELPSFRE